MCIFYFMYDLMFIIKIDMFIYRYNFINTLLMKEVNLIVDNVNLLFTIGSNAIENTNLIEDSDENCYWFHADGSPSCHIVLTLDTQLSDLKAKTKNKIFKQGCLLCKQHTNSLKSTKNTKFVYTKISNLITGDKPGSVYFKDNTILKYISI